MEAPTPRAELHFHLLPGVDDGPQDMDEALELARMALEDGTTTVVATPHVRDIDVDTIPERVAQLRDALRAAAVPLEVLGGAEVAWDDLATLSDRQLELVAQGPPGRRWVLYETPLFPGAEQAFRAGGEELHARGYAALVGHPERSPQLWEDGLPYLGDALDRSAPLQINASSLLGRHGREARRLALDLARSERPALLASDAHRPTRGPSLTAAVDVLVADGLERAAVEPLAGRLPRRLLTEGLGIPGGH